jgi:hypothetical protein
MNPGGFDPKTSERKEILPREVQISNVSPDVEYPDISRDFLSVSMQMLVQIPTASSQVLSTIFSQKSSILT